MADPLRLSRPEVLKPDRRRALSGVRSNSEPWGRDWASRAIACNGLWHLRRSWHLLQCEFCNLHSVQGGCRFESHPHRQNRISSLEASAEVTPPEGFPSRKRSSGTLRFCKLTWPR
jgi:hypothetical protein